MGETTLRGVWGGENLPEGGWVQTRPLAPVLFFAFGGLGFASRLPSSDNRTFSVFIDGLSFQRQTRITNSTRLLCKPECQFIAFRGRGGGR